MELAPHPSFLPPEPHVVALFVGLGLALELQVVLEALRREDDPANMAPERRLFKYSILYLFLLFGAVAVDRWIFAR